MNATGRHGTSDVLPENSDLVGVVVRGEATKGAAGAGSRVSGGVAKPITAAPAFTSLLSVAACGIHRLRRDTR